MYLLEHDAKTLLGAAGVPVPPGCLVESVEALAGVALPPGPWVVKAQVPVGGRGKAGLVKITESLDELSALVDAMLGKTHRGHVVGSCRIESCRSAPNEVYLGFMLAPETGEVRVLATPSGGVEVESSGGVQSRIVAPELEALVAAVTDLASSAPEPIRHAMIEAGRSLGDFFLQRDAVLLEINPLFVQPDGSWLAGDAKMVIDDNAITRQPEAAALLEARSQAYVETYTKYRRRFVDDADRRTARQRHHPIQLPGCTHWWSARRREPTRAGAQLDRRRAERQVRPGERVCRDHASG
jgi:succinyl-CoA synthetase beta subunit